MANILLIEPDKLLARTYAVALEGCGHSVQTSLTAQGAVGLADETRPDVVVLELQLAAHGGVEFLYEFRSYADWQKIPIIILSHVPLAELRGSMRTLGGLMNVGAYCYKPQTSLKHLLKTVEAALEPAHR